ncbi:phosphatidylinositol N-acetylglucosaminyltransferase subunit A-like [Uloborus diversus]|uniref:phosphatidylinositol N-acetylglucosaminyltransferase subunit A-like n=1 Tax=Uloborus diversus TaxID=327109 RepID=UPI00240A0EBF|nr:phosphatidylinositol N-acetylglucosaminyltransferase subunit A-like [Uloborus diversus]
MRKRKHRICMVSDFFYPNTGGVESHIYQLSQCLLKKGHKVIVITHAYGDRKGVRYLTKGLKIYYIPVWVVYNQCTFPTLFTTFPLIRYILLREKISIVHGHSAFSALAHEAMFHAKTMGLKTVFTDHSLFGFADASAIITNKLLQMTLSICNHVICVSHTGKENTALRANVRPNLIAVIPNAVDTAIFKPDLNKEIGENVTVVVISRLVYRKGIDLLAGVIPVICAQHPEVNFIIGGDGPKRIVLEEVRERCQLQERVTLLGSIKHENVRDVLVKGDIYLNASLTEAFCMAILEAACCGLQVVSTSVGGVPEVLPPDHVWLTEPTVNGLIEGLEQAISDRANNKIVPKDVAYKKLSKMYRWNDVAVRTEHVYDTIVNEPIDDFPCRLKKFWQQGYIAGEFFMLLQAIEHLLFLFYSWMVPENLIDTACDIHLK